MQPLPLGPVSAPVSPEQALQALAQAAQALAQLASALSGQVAPGGLCSLSPASTLTLIELVNEFLLAKARAGRSDRYLRELRTSLGHFAHGRGHLPIDQVELHTIERWLNRSEWAPRTKKGYLTDLRTLFSWAMRRGYLSKNVAAMVELPVVEDKPPGIHTPEQALEVLTAAREHSPAMCRAMAIRYFAGLRSSEVARLEEREIGRDYIEVTALKSKTRRRRLVRIRPNLRAWLALGGELPLRNVNSLMCHFVASLKVPWSNNVTRHSFVSYHLAAFGSASKTALEAGHTEGMVFAHYRELVARSAALAYWRLEPG